MKPNLVNIPNGVATGQIITQWPGTTRMIKYSKAGLFDAAADVIVTSASVAGDRAEHSLSEVHRRYPSAFEAYMSLAGLDGLSVGDVLRVSIYPELDYPKSVYHAITRQRHGQPSRIEWIERCLQSIVNELAKDGAKSIVMPALGCGAGRLDWLEVRRSIDKVLSAVPDDVVITVLEPPADITGQESQP